MPLFNVDLIFEGSNFFGWSERYFFVGATLVDAYTAANTDLAPARIAWLPTFNGLTFVRASTPGKPPDSFVLAYGIGGQGTYAAIAGSKLLPADSRVMVHLQATNVLKNHKFCGGLFSQDTTGDNFTPTAPWIAAFAAYIAVLQTSGWVAASTYHPIPAPPQDYAAIATAFADPLVRNRKSGRPFGVPRGRRRTTLVA